MEMSLKLSFNDMTKLFDSYSKRKVYCNCGHSLIMPLNKDKKICKWCGRYVFKDKRVEFDYRLREELHNVNRSR